MHRRLWKWNAEFLFILVLLLGMAGCSKPPNQSLSIQAVANIVAWAPENQTYDAVVAVLGPPSEVEQQNGGEVKAQWFRGVDVMKLSMTFKNGYLTEYEVQETPAKGLERRRELLDEL